MFVKASDMNPVKSLSKKTYDEIKEYCLSCSPSLNLSSQIKLFLRDDLVGVVDKLDQKDSSVSINDFLALVDSYFETLDFCYGNYDDEKLQIIKDDIGEMFAYVDSLDLKDDFTFRFVQETFERLREFDDDESRGIYDLLTLDTVKNSKVMHKYLESNNVKHTMLFKFTKHLYKHLDTLDDKEREKIDYVFHSSYETLCYFLNYSDEIELYFNKNILDSFNKETLSLIFRTLRYDEYKTFFKLPKDVLEVISVMNEYVLQTTGNNSAFLSKVIVPFHEELMCKDAYINIFKEYYEKYFEIGKAKGFDKDEVFNELLSFILTSNSLHLVSNSHIFSLGDLFKARRKKMENLYSKAYGAWNLLKIKYGVLDSDDLIQYPSYKDLMYLKDAFFYRIYGITTEEVYGIKERYGKFLDVCEKSFLDEDKATLEMLKTICQVADLDVNDKEKIRELQKSFYRYIKQNGLYKINNNASIVMVKELLNRMYMNAYNQVLYEPKADNILYYQRGVPVIDSTVNFNMIVNSINGVGEFFRKKDNAKVRYNTTSESNNQGICASFINNENLGVIGLNGPLLAYTNLNSSTLAAMGIGDIYSETGTISLKQANVTIGEGNYFLTPKEYADYTRFGYNEMVFDRFLYRDEKSELKVQPSYVVCYKMDENYKSTRMYKKGLKMAKEFGIPLVLVDVLKVKEHERDTILEMERELFAKEEVDKDLMQAIITRYMNNYSGTMTICRTREQRGNNWQYKKDFSLLGLSRFINKVEKKFEGLDQEGIASWYDALKECYLLEEEKNLHAQEVTSFANSLEHGEFVLDDVVFFMDRINAIKDRALNRSLMKNNLVEVDKISYNPRVNPIPELDVIVDLANYLFEGQAYVMTEDSGGKRIFLTKEANQLSDEEKTDYGLIISYMLGNYHDNYFANLDTCDLNELEFKSYDFDLKTDLMHSEYYADKIRVNEHVIDLASKVATMKEKEFKKIFKPIIDDVTINRGLSSEILMRRLEKRKKHIVSEFAKLPVKVENVTSVKKK